ncbi:MAG: hypothetical protein HEQ35_14940 [Gloeotrichia echinulata IR180]|jgi:hypothetical protein
MEDKYLQQLDIQLRNDQSSRAGKAPKFYVQGSGKRDFSLKYLIGMP